MKLKSDILVDTVVYGLTGYLSVFVSIFLTPIYTRIFTKVEYGIMDVFNVWNNLALAILPLGLYNAIIRFYPDIKDDQVARKKMLGTVLSILVLVGMAYLVLMILVKGIFIKTFFEEPGLTGIYYMSVVIVFGNLILSYHKTLLRIEFRKWPYLVVSLVNFIILSFFGFALVYYGKYRVEGFFIASVIAVAAALIFSFIYLRNETFIYYDKSQFRLLISFSIHFLSIFILLKITDLIDRYLLKEYLSMEEIGIYSIGFRIGNIYNFLLSAFYLAWMPYVMNIKDKPKAGKIIRNYFEIFLVVSSLVVGLIILFRKELIAFFAPDYHTSYPIIAILVSYNFIMGFAYFITLGIQIKNKTKYYSIVAVVSVLTNIITSILLVRWLGSPGIALGTLVGGIVWILVLHIISQNVFMIKFNYMIILMMLIGIMVLFLLSNVIDKFTDHFQLYLYKGLCCLLFASFMIVYTIRKYRFIRINNE